MLRPYYLIKICHLCGVVGDPYGQRCDNTKCEGCGLEFLKVTKLVPEQIAADTD